MNFRPPSLFLMFLCLCGLAAVISCAGPAADPEAGDDDHSAGDGPDGHLPTIHAIADDDATDDDQETECDDHLRPIVYIVGIVVNGESFSEQTMRFASNDYCLDRLYAYDWNAFAGYWREPQNFSEFIDRVLVETGAEQVDLIAHSLGADVAAEYLKQPDQAAKVAHYAQIAALPCLEIQGAVPALNISSEVDYVVGVCEVEKAENLIVQDLDHLETATSAETFAALFQFFNDGAPPVTLEVVPEEKIRLSGRTLIYLINEPAAGVEIEIYETDPATGERLHQYPEGAFLTEAQGDWGAFTAKPGAYYEFVCLDPFGHWPPLHYYREPFRRSNNKVYFRVYPPPESFLGGILDRLPRADAVAAFSWMNINHAVIAGRDTLTVNEIDLAIEEIADPLYTTLLIMFGDINFNGQSDELPMGSLLISRRFIKLFDLLIPTDAPQPIKFDFDGRTMAVWNWKAQTEGISTAVFE